jgi:hypothetical protein
MTSVRTLMFGGLRDWVCIWEPRAGAISPRRRGSEGGCVMLSGTSGMCRFCYKSPLRPALTMILSL